MDARLPDDLAAAVSEFVERRIGLHFPPQRWPDLSRGLRSAATELEFSDPAECARWLLAGPVRAEHVELLAAHLTIGETYFFRDPKAFEVLETKVLPELRAARQRGVRRLRIWSAGCCTGEEAYSIAISVHRALRDLHDWQVTILGTDINPRFLRKAAEGIYTSWSFRGVAERVRNEYFEEMAKGRFQVKASIRAMVAFTCVNLVEDVFPSLTNHTNAMDVIFCRNVLMYFRQERATKVADSLHHSLVDGGWLFASATEASQQLFAGFTAAKIPGVSVWRKLPRFVAPEFEGEPPESASGRVVLTEGETVSRRRPPVPARASEAGAKRFAGARTDLPASSGPLEAARALANEGRLSEAFAACDRAVAADKLSAPAHYLRGLIAQEQGAGEEAVNSLRRALFLDPDFVVAHFALGHLYERLGRREEAVRCLENARHLLSGYDPAASLPESDGVTAGRMLAILSAMPQPVA